MTDTVAHIVYLVSSSEAGVGGDTPSISLSTSLHNGSVDPEGDVTFSINIPTENYSIFYNGVLWTDYTKLNSLVIRFPFAMKEDDVVQMQIQTLN